MTPDAATRRRLLQVEIALIRGKSSRFCYNAKS